ncbi:MAG: 4-aminobutyrate--2-oxoglutarate transaminase [Actinobacteria bacterium]|nr:4-aminobutyrate--2-oxoglutarate transaminase [Actinomycetota bacterium]
MTETTTFTPTAGGPGLPQVRRIVTELPGPKSAALMARRDAAVANALSPGLPAYIEYAGGGVLVDVDGNSFIDMASGIAVTTVGNADPRVVAAVQKQAAAFTHTCFMIAPYEGYVQVCEALNRLTPGDHAKKSILLNSGAEAVENAVKIARVYTKRQAIVVFEHAYHGRTNLTMALTAKNMPYKEGFGPFAGEIHRMPMSYPFRNSESGPEMADIATTRIDKEIGGHNVAAIIIEPIMGEGGFIVPAPGFLKALRDYCTANGILLVADEIQTGFGRTGAWFACEHEGVVPDLITTAKGIADGMPLSAVTGRAEVMDSVHKSGLGGTYSGNPVACAAALAAIETFEKDDLLARARHIETVMKARLADIQAATGGVIGDIRGRGAMIAIEMVQPDSKEPNAGIVGKVVAHCVKQGVFIITAGTYGNVIRFLPPLVISDQLLNDAFDVIKEAFLASV